MTDPAQAPIHLAAPPPTPGRDATYARGITVLTEPPLLCVCIWQGYDQGSWEEEDEVVLPRASWSRLHRMATGGSRAGIQIQCRASVTITARVLGDRMVLECRGWDGVPGGDFFRCEVTPDVVQAFAHNAEVMPW